MSDCNWRTATREQWQAHLIRINAPCLRTASVQPAREESQGDRGRRLSRSDPQPRQVAVEAASHSRVTHSRDELTREGFEWTETRTCKQCGVWIEIWRTDVKSRVALEVRPDEEWKLFPHVYFCRGKAVPNPVQSGATASRIQRRGMLNVEV